MKNGTISRFGEMSRLYHFTSFEAACKIIESGMLRFGKPFRMNDLIESNRIVFQRTYLNDMSEDKGNGLYAEAEMHRYQQISFSQDRKIEGNDILGFDLHSMWGLYADCGYGVCLVFDKKKLKLDKGDYGSDVRYCDFPPTSFIINNRSKSGIRAEVWRKKDTIFFYKKKEWEHEQEYRIIRRARSEMDDEYLDVSDSLSFAIICKDYSVFEQESMFDGDYYKDLRYINKRLPVLTYENGLDGFTLFRRFMEPIWAEQIGFF